MNINVLLTGGAGYIASHTAVALTNSVHHVFLYDNNCNSKPGVAIRLGEITGHRIPLIKGDIRDTALLADTLIKRYQRSHSFCRAKSGGRILKETH